MAPLIDDEASKAINASTDNTYKPRLLIIGAGSRGNAYARAVVDSGLGIVAAIAEPIAFKRKQLGSQYIWKDSKRTPEQEFEGWRQFIQCEYQRRKDESAGIPVPPGVDGAFICVHDEHHIDVLTAIIPLGLHLMAEKPLATTLQDCLSIQSLLQSYPPRIFAIGHVLRYSPHNMLLHHLLREKRVIGDILSIEHTEPVGWWHFSHSYVRGHWRKESTTAPSLLTKSCHDIDFLLWLLCSPGPDRETTHLPARLSSHGSLKQFRRSQKPAAAGEATNCLSCPLVDTCKFSAKRIYHTRHLAHGLAKWPVEIVNPEVESRLHTSGPDAAQSALFKTLSEDYTPTTPQSTIDSRAWYGRCVFESDNDVLDDQFVTIEWDDHPTSSPGCGSKTANFHMIAQTLAQCHRRGVIYGTAGEIIYDSKSITVNDFERDKTRIYHPEVPENSHHGGGDDGLTACFLKAIRAVQGGKGVGDAQGEWLGVTIEEVVRSHAVVFAAEEARGGRR
ncbi:NAD binding Rossmann fold oxidoreductase like protein, partial [Zymoseptoria brevis]